MKVSRAVEHRLQTAQSDVEVARAEILATLEEIRHRLDPRTIVAETAERGFARATAALDDAQVGLRSRPWLVALGATLFGIALAARARLQAETADTAARKETETAAEG